MNYGVKLAADKLFSIRVADDSEKVNSQTSRGKPGIPARKYKITKKEKIQKKKTKKYKKNTIHQCTKKIQHAKYDYNTS